MNRRTLFLIVLTISVGFPIYAQTHTQDSLRSIWTNEKAQDTLRLSAIDSYIKLISLGQFDSIKEYARLQYDFAKSKGLKKQMFVALEHLAGASKNNFNTSLKYRNEQVDIANILNDKTLLFDSYLGLYILFSSRSEHQKSIEYGEKCLEIANQLQDKGRIAQSKHFIGLGNDNLGNSDEALIKYKEALEIAEEINDERGIANYSASIGVVYMDQGNNYEAIRYLLKSLDIVNKFETKAPILLLYLTSVYLQQEKFDLALKYVNQALPQFEQINDSLDIAYCLEKFGDIYKHKEDLNMALKYYDQSFKIRTKLNDRSGVARSLFAKGNIQKRLGNYSKAKSYLNESLRLSEQIKSKHQITCSLLSLAETSLLEKQYSLVTPNLMRAHDIALEMGHIDLLEESNNLLSQLYEGQSNYKQAYKHYQEYIKLRDSTQNIEVKQELISQNYKFEYQQKQLKDSIAYAQKRQLADLAYENKLTEERKARNVLVAVLVLLAAITFLIFNNYRIKQRANRQLEELNFKLKLFNNVVAHDLKTPIVSFKALIDKFIEKYGTAIAEKDIHLLKLTDKKIGQLNKMVSDLLLFYSLGHKKNVQLEESDVDFKDLVTGIKQELTTDYGKEIVLNTRNLPKLRVNENLLYQLFTNLMSNSIKYSKPTVPLKIDITAKEVNGTYEFCLADNGLGISDDFKKVAFDLFSRVNQTDNLGHGLGLTICKNIVDHHKGRIWIENNKNSGASFYFTLNVAA